MIYWTMHPYLGIGINASSYLPTAMTNNLPELTLSPETAGVRFKNTHHRKAYLAGEYLDTAHIDYLDKIAVLNEHAFLALRTDAGLIYDEQLAQQLFVPDYHDRLHERAQEGYLVATERKIALTAKGLDVYNTIITDLFRTI